MLKYYNSKKSASVVHVYYCTEWLVIIAAFFEMHSEVQRSIVHNNGFIRKSITGAFTCTLINYKNTNRDFFLRII